MGSRRLRAGAVAGSAAGGALLGALAFAPATGIAQETTSSSAEGGPGAGTEPV